MIQRDPAASPHHGVTTIILMLTGLALATSWLLLLVLVNFSSWAVSLGLLGVLWVMGLPSTSAGGPPGRSSRSGF